MQVCNCLVALAGDLNNKGVIENVTPGEIDILRLIHGAGSVSDVHIVRKMHPQEYSHEGLYHYLRGKYPVYEELVKNYWRDRGANLPTDVREINLPEGTFRLPPDMMVESLGKPKAEEAVELAAPKKRGRPAAPKPVEEPDPDVDAEFDPED